MSSPGLPIPATLIPGDGIGPEITDAALSVLDALGAPFQWTRWPAVVKAAGDPLPPATLDSIDRTRLALKGPLERSPAAATALERAPAREVQALRQPAPSQDPGARRALR